MYSLLEAIRISALLLQPFIPLLVSFSGNGELMTLSQIEINGMGEVKINYQDVIMKIIDMMTPKTRKYYIEILHKICKLYYAKDMFKDIFIKILELAYGDEEKNDNNNKIPQEDLCAVCNTYKRSQALNFCGHLLTCSQCSWLHYFNSPLKDYEYSTGKDIRNITCPYCKQISKSYIIIYKS